MKDKQTKTDKKYNKKIEELEERLQKSEDMCIDASQRAKRNEQYSRKNNIKIFGIPDERHETQIALTEKVQGLLNICPKVFFF